ncbi:hypothetical protein [Mesorhizobium sp. M0578]|uniref:hypothetical protein n=1 Tax=unclassified Mesorhizobium TaxID=325217 RepID=UPI00333830C8
MDIDVVRAVTPKGSRCPTAAVFAACVLRACEITVMRVFRKDCSRSVIDGIRRKIESLF